jgi:hypothetical protein
MFESHIGSTLIRATILSTASICGSAKTLPAQAPDDPRARGIGLYEKGDDPEAMKSMVFFREYHFIN